MVYQQLDHVIEINTGGPLTAMTADNLVQDDAPASRPLPLLKASPVCSTPLPGPLPGTWPSTTSKKSAKNDRMRKPEQTLT